MIVVVDLLVFLVIVCFGCIGYGFVLVVGLFCCVYGFCYFDGVDFWYYVFVDYVVGVVVDGSVVELFCLVGLFVVVLWFDFVD